MLVEKIIFCQSTKHFIISHFSLWLHDHAKWKIEPNCKIGPLLTGTCYF